MSFRKSVTVLIVLLLCTAVTGGVVFRIAYPLRYRNELVASAEDFCLPAAFVAAVVQTESRFDPQARSQKGAVGLMQLLPSTADFIAARAGLERGELTDPSCNLALGCAYLAYLWVRYGDERLVLCAYNAGEGRVDGWLADPRYSKDGTLNEIPFAETRAYVGRVLRRFRVYARVYGLSATVSCAERGESYKITGK